MYTFDSVGIREDRNKLEQMLKEFIKSYKEI